VISASTWLEWIGAQSLQIAIVAAIIWIATWLWASNRPHMAHALWAIVLIKCVVPPIGSPIGVMNWIDMSRLAPRIDNFAEASDNSGSLETQSGQVSHFDAIHEHSVITKQAVTGIAFSSEGYEAWQTTIGQCSELLPVTLIAGAMFSLLWMAVRYGHFLFFIHVARTVDRPDLLECTLRLCKTLGIRQRVRIKVLESPIGPAVIGWFRPTILLPRLVVDGRSAAQIELLLAHELIHIRRGDLLWALLQTLASRLWWFHPMVWMAGRKAVYEAERSCDAETIAAMKCSPARYARELLNVLERKHELRVAPALPGVRPIDITRKRLEHIMRLTHGSPSRTPRSAQAIAIIAGCLLLPSSTQLVAQTKVEAISPSETLQETPVVDRGFNKTEPPKDWSLQIRFATMESSEFNNLVIEWSLASSLEKANSIATESATKQTASSPSVSSASVVERNTPVLYSILKVDEANAILNQVQKSARTNVLNAPRILVPDNQLATVEDVKKTPYAAGNQKVQIVDSGTKINVRPSFQAGNIVRLNCDLSISDVSSHETIELQLRGNAKTSIEVPEVAKTNIECELDLPFRETLVLSQVSGKNKNPMLVMITCEPYTEPHTDLPTAEFAGLASSATGKNAQASGDLSHPFVVMGPLEGLDSKTSGEPPSDDEVVHAFEKSRSTKSPVVEDKQKRRHAKVTREKINETAEPARFVPLIGYASLRHAIYKCTIEFVTTNLPSPNLKQSIEEHSFYIDYNRFRTVDDPEATK
jgi:beta-lactamase regulating signal transducer with metallopeptidase domain